jgi:transposase-like protein
VIAVAVRWYLRYGLSYRGVEELLAERGVTAGHVTVYWWVQRFTPEFTGAARRFFERALHTGTVPAEVTTDRASWPLAR